MTKLLPVDSESFIPKPSIYRKIGKNICVEFDKCFDVCKSGLNTFLITKSAYSKNNDMICRYSNVFFKSYDPDKEFLTALLMMKYQIDSTDIHYSYKTFLSDISEYLLSDTIVKKIFKMVDDYYTIDLTPSDEVKSLDLHALQFMNDHGKALMALSIAYKLTTPIVCHFYALNHEKMAEINRAKGDAELTIKDYIYNVFVSYFPLFEGDSDLFNKLAVTVNSHLVATKSSDKTLWTRAKNKKLTPTIYMDKLIAVIVVDLLPKAVFDKNIIFLIQVAIPYQIKNILLAKDKYEYCDISTEQKNDELSGLEKMEANCARISDLDIIVSDLNIKSAISKIQSEFKIDITKDEIDYYRKNLRSFVFSDVILQFFAKYFGGYYDLKSISKKNYIVLLIIFKHIMADMGFIYIHQIMTGNISKVIKRRKISTKQLKKIENSPKFKKIMKLYSMGMDVDNNSIIRNIAMLINTPIEYVDYNNQERFGENIIADIDIVSDEYLRMIKML